MQEIPSAALTNKFRMTRSAFALFLIIIISCNIQKAGRTASGDGSANLTEDDRKSIRPFSIENALQKPVTQTNDILLQEINSEQLKQVISGHAYTWVVIWAAWCPHCIDAVPNYPVLAEKFNDKGLNLVLINQDYNVPKTRELLQKAGYKGNAYILDAAYFGTDERVKVLKLRKEICSSCPQEGTGTPHHYLFDRSGKNLYFKMGYKMMADSIAAYVK
jgi:thiol-disulfide isomerase/thioredoxin